MPERKPGELEKINGEEKPGELDNAMLRMAGAESPEDREEPLTKGTLGEAVSADVESAMREQAGQNQEKIDAILEGALKIYEEAKKTGPIHEAIEKADEFMDSAAREAGIGVGRVMELFTEKIPPDELARASPEVTAGERNEEIPVSPRDVVEKPTPAPAPAETVTAEPKASASAEATADKPAEAAPLSARPEARPRTESEISEEEKDAITQATLDVFRQELKTASVSVAEEAARGKFKETAGNLDKKTYEELRQKVTQEINALEAEERKKMKVAETAAEIKPKTPEPEKPAEIPPDTEKPASVPSEVEENQVEGPAPAELPAEEKPQTAKTETAEAAELPPPSELTAEELEAIFAVANKAETIKDIENLPEAAKEKLGLGFNNLGFYVEENKNKFFAGTIEKAAEKLNLDQKGTWGRFVSSLAENYRRDQAKAQEKFEAAKRGDEKTLSNISLLANNILRYGRLALDATGYSVVAPLRFVTLGAMAFARGAEAAKEARFKNEETIEKTRVDDINRAEDEAWRIYEAAQLKAGDGEVTSAELNRAFTENLPRDIHNRLMSSEADPAIKTNIATRIIKDLTERWIDSSLWRVQKKLDQAGTEAEKQKILKKYEGKLKDFNRLVGDYGQIDALALGAKISEGAAKGVRMAMTVETLFELPFAAQKIWSDLAGTLGERGEDADILALKSRLVESQSYAAELKSFSDETAESTRNLYAKVRLGINLEDGCTEAEAGRIADDIAQLESEGKKDTAKAALEIFGSLKTSDTGKTVAEIIGARQEKLADLYDRALGVDSKDGLDVDEMEVKGTGQTLEDLIRESAPAPETVPAAEPSPEPMPESKSPPEPVPESVTESAPASQESPVGPASTPETKPGRFENVIDSSQVEGSDSIWKSTREIFIKNAREFGFDAQRDGSLEKWAETETANAVKELADREYGGKITDLVHAGDKVTIEIGDDGQPRLKFENLSGIKPDYLPEKPETGTDALKATPSAEGIEAPSPSGVEKAEIKTDSLAREYEAIPAGDPRRDEFVYNYIAAEIEKPAYRELKLPHMNKEKLIAFARMFGGDDWARINSPEKLAQTLVEFDNGMKFYTQKLVDGSLDRIFKEGDERALELTHNVFPVEAQDGEIFYAQMQKAGLWQIADSNGDPVELKRPIMGKTRFFGLKKVKNLLGYKSK